MDVRGVLIFCIKKSFTDEFLVLSSIIDKRANIGKDGGLKLCWERRRMLIQICASKNKRKKLEI